MSMQYIPPELPTHTGIDSKVWAQWDLPDGPVDMPGVRVQEKSVVLTKDFHGFLELEISSSQVGSFHPNLSFNQKALLCL